MSDLGEVIIGGKVRDRKVSEAISFLPMNKTMVVQKLTADPQASPEIVEGLETIDQVFEYFKPEVAVTFEDKEGNEKDENLTFSHLGDFGAKGVMKQSNYLKNLAAEKDELFRFMKILKSNKVLQKILQNPEEKQAYVAALQELLSELENAK